ncbi:hypothetical protein [Polluticaenibacter yanchengensis]|uniref:DUF3592 domain-containing protein n=1 Tax=Polluticaenibacter yanchengensis TaxID=3014562 RepID=A0ABT4UMV7_9BACT|nr:hypothetical protein [Chitinophagaceae bacterium LY-5]
MKSYIVAGIIFLVAFIFQLRRNAEVNDIVEYGQTEKVVIIDKTDNCTNNTRNTNNVTIKTKRASIYRISIAYKECVKLNIGDSILIRYMNDRKDVLRVYNYNKPETVKKTNIDAYLFLVISLAFFIGAFINRSK